MIREIWEKWCREAADKAGLTVEELKRRLANNEAVLEILATIDTKEEQ